MIYPVYVCLGDETTAHGAEIPDIPGCFAASDECDDLPAHMLDAFRLSMEGTAEEPPAPSTISSLEARYDFEGGIWMLFNTESGELRPPTSDH